MFGHGGVLQKSLVPLPSPSRRHTPHQQHIPTPENGHQIHEHVRQNGIPSQCGSSPPSRSESDGVRRETGHQYPETSGGPLQVSACGKSDWPECSAVPDYSCVRCTSAQGRPVYPRWLPSTTGPLRSNDVAMAP